MVLLWQETLPAYKPLFTDVRDRVAADYRENEKRRLFIERGNALKAQLQAAAKTPAGFAEKAASEKLEVKSYANFTSASRRRICPSPPSPPSPASNRARCPTSSASATRACWSTPRKRSYPT